MLVALLPFAHFKGGRSLWASCLGLVFLLGCLTATGSGGVGAPALGDEALVMGDVIERQAIDSASIGVAPAQRLWRFKLHVVSLGESPREDIKAGEIIEVYSNEVNAPAAADKRVVVRIGFLGEPTNGRFWIVGLVEPSSR